MELSKCLGCMEDFRGYPCPKCGYDPKTAKNAEYALTPGTILAGKYLVGKVLGQGGFGITYIGWDIPLERKVAVKEYYPSGQVSRSPGTRNLTWYTTEAAEQARRDGMQMFLKEARKMSRADGIPGVVRVLDLFQENGTAYIVMEFIEGVTLKAKLQQTGPLPWEQVRELFLSVIQTMAQVHKAGLVHRDLSPDNIMLLPNGGVKILDLGAAKDLSINSGASSMQVAKSGFSPLEQYTQRGGSGPWTDVYSMAATIYYTLTGKLPSNAIDRMETDTLSWDFLVLNQLPTQARETLQKALAVTAKKRTQSMEELERGLFAEAPQPKPEPEPKPKPKPEPKKAPKKIICAAVAAVAIVLCGVVYGTVLKPANDYKKAQALLDAGKYEEAETAFAALGDYQDSAEQVQEAQKAGAYQRADALEEFGQYPGAAIAFSKLGDYLDSAQRAESAKGMQQIIPISVGWGNTVGLHNDGTVVAVGDNDDGQCDVSGWSDIVAIAAGGYHTVGLRRDGTVVAVGAAGSGRANNYGQCDVSGWSDIVAVAAGRFHTVGLRRDGTVVAVGGNRYDKCDVSGWSDIVAVAAGITHIVGLRRDGTVVAVGDNDDGQCDVSGWSDIVAVAAGGHHTVGLRRDGTVVAVGYNEYGQCDVSGWSDIVAVAAGGFHTVGLRSDGTVATVGHNKYGQCDVSGWSDIVAVAAGTSHTVGLRSDGTVVAVGSNHWGQCDVDDWKGIRTP